MNCICYNITAETEKKRETERETDKETETAGERRTDRENQTDRNRQRERQSSLRSLGFSAVQSWTLIKTTLLGHEPD